ncbi:integrase [bacterium]|nr:MAG: integrase [bacterium]
MPQELAIVVHESALVPVQQPDLISLLLNDKRSPHTRDAYARDLRDFFGDAIPIGEACARFVQLPVPAIRLALLTYKTKLRERAMSEATINRRFAAIRSLLKFAHRIGQCATDGTNIAEGEKVTAYRDTRGVDVATLRKLLAAPAKRFPVREAPHIYKDGKDRYIDVCQSVCVRAREIPNALRQSRDLALLHLLIENALRRGEVCKLDCGDFDASTRSLWILGKGRGNQKERVSLSPTCTLAITNYLTHSEHGSDRTEPLFISLDSRPAFYGARLSDAGLYSLVGEYGVWVGLKRLTPHQLRHSAITAALDATGGDVRKVQRLSRHKKLETLMIYDDSRADHQGEVSGLLSDLVMGRKKPRS